MSAYHPNSFFTSSCAGTLKFFKMRLCKIISTIFAQFLRCNFSISQASEMVDITQPNFFARLWKNYGRKNVGAGISISICVSVCLCAYFSFSRDDYCYLFLFPSSLPPSLSLFLSLCLSTRSFLYLSFVLEIILRKTQRWGFYSSRTFF